MKEITYEDLQRANETINTTDIKGKEYAEVNQRIKAFRMIYPQGTIETTMVSNENGICVFKAKVGFTTTIINGETGSISQQYNLLATGTAYEKENSSFINKTSYIENCETSAVGRALGMAGFGIDTSVASAEEVQNAMNNQVTITTEEEARSLELTFGKHKGRTIGELVDEESSYIDYLFQNGTPDIKQAITILTGMVEMSNEEGKEEINNMPIIETQKQQIKETFTAEEIKEILIKHKKSKLSDLTFKEAKDLLANIDEIEDAGDR